MESRYAAYKFQCFLSDPQVYTAAQQYWADMFTDIVSHAGKKTQWAPWFEPCFVDGTPRRDGNPIWSTVSYEAHKGIRIIQDEPGAFAPEITAWIDTFGDPAYDECIEELVISCIPSDTTEPIAYKLMHVFVVENLSKEEMEKLIESYVS
jgi:hypothetical protein